VTATDGGGNVATTASTSTATPVVALIGRPNVGKSSLFNRLVGGTSAIVSDEPGTTRDRHFASVEWAGHRFYLVDTGGIVDDPHEPLDLAIRRQVAQAIEEADLLLLVVDAKTGMHPSDFRILDLLRDTRRPWLVVANKVDDATSTDFYEFFELGAGDPIPVSAINGKRSGDLLDAIVARIPVAPPAEGTTLRVAVVGRPNVGKSSFVNRLLGEERLVVSDAAGTTRDAIDAPRGYHGRELVFVDTAGLRRQARIGPGIEFYSSLRARRAIERSDICILLVDAVTGIEAQDLKIATLVWDAGRGLIVVVNKWDLAEKSDNTAARFEETSVAKSPDLAFVPFLFASALTGQRVTRVLDLLLEVDAERHKRIPTAEVNETLAALVARRQPPQSHGGEIRLKYATQVEVAPPAIAVFGNHPEFVPDHYVRYLHNGFRAAWGFTGNPLRVLMRSKSA
jgi:GTP-binding protein